MEDFDLGVKAFCFCWVSHLMCYLNAKEPQRLSPPGWPHSNLTLSFPSLETHAWSF